MREYQFTWWDEHKGYDLFPKELENDPCVLFHGTAQKNLQLIIDGGFKAFPPLESVSYAKQSRYCLSHLCGRRSSDASENDVIIAVRFESLALPKIVVNHADIHVYDAEIQPEVIGFCVVPYDYTLI